MHVDCSHRHIQVVDPFSVFKRERERAALSVVESLDMSHNDLTYVGNLQAFSSLATLNLSYNNISVVRGLPLSISRLDLSHNALSTLDGLAELPNIAELDLSHNRLTSLVGLPRNRSLRILRLGSNRIASTAQLSTCSGVEVLDLSDNHVASISDLDGLRGLSVLSHLILRGNPIADTASYRAVIARGFPQLQTLDDASLVRARAAASTAVPPRAGAVPQAGPRSGSSRKGGMVPGRSAPVEAMIDSVGVGSSDTVDAAATVAHLVRGAVSSTPGDGSDTPPDMSGFGPVAVLDAVSGSPRARSVGRASVRPDGDLSTADPSTLRAILQEEMRLSSDLARALRKAETDLRDTRKVMGDELLRLRSARGEVSSLAKELEVQRNRADKAVREFRYAHNKLMEERSRRCADADEITNRHSALLAARDETIAQHAERLRRAGETETSLRRENERLKEYVRALELEHSRRAVLDSRVQNSKAPPAEVAAASAAADASLSKAAHALSRLETDSRERAVATALAQHMEAAEGYNTATVPASDGPVTADEGNSEFAGALREWLLKEVSAAAKEGLGRPRSTSM